jgi:hypothetical protein
MDRQIPVLPIDQGTTRIIVVSELRDARGQFLDPTGWSIHAVARAENVRGPIVAEWRSTPAEDEGLAEVVAADVLIAPSADPAEKWIYLHIQPSMSDEWSFVTAELWIEVQEPAPGSQQEAFKAHLTLDQTTVY